MTDHDSPIDETTRTPGGPRPRRFASLGWRILFWTSLVALLPLLIMASQGYHCARQAIYDAKEAHLQSVLASGTAQFAGRLDKVRDDLNLLAAVPCLIEDTAAAAQDGRTSFSAQTSHLLEQVRAGSALYEEIQVFDSQWNVLAGAAKTTPTKREFPTAQFRSTLDRATTTTATALPLPHDGMMQILAGRPVFDAKGSRIAYLVARLEASRFLDRAIQDRVGLGGAGSLHLLPPDAPYPPASSVADRPPAHHHGPAPTPAAAASPTVREYVNPQGVRVFGAAAAIPGLDWILVAEFDWEQAFGWLSILKIRAVATGSVTLLLVLIVAARGAGKLSQPLRELAGVARRIAAGSHDERLGPMGGTEAQEVSRAFNTMLDALAASHRRLMHAASLAAVGELSSSTVHEMRNPLSSVKINLQAMQKKVADSPAYSELAKIALEQIGRVETMLSDLLGYGKPLELKLSRVIFGRLAAEVLPIVGSEAEQKGVALEIEDHLGGREFTADAEQLRRALTNLVGNALEAAPPGGRVRLAARIAPAEPDAVEIRVSDNGPGIPEAQMDRIFKPFFTTRETGTGLGLANVKKIVDYHGGVVAADNRPEGGALFTIRLPVGGPPA